MIFVAMLLFHSVAHGFLRCEVDGLFGRANLGTGNIHFNGQYLPSSSCSNFRLDAARDNNDETNVNSNIIPEKIRWIFDEAEGDYLDDDDDESFFDDLFMTDDEDDGYNNGGNFITDDNEEPDDNLSDGNLLQLDDTYSKQLLTSPSMITEALNVSSIESLVAGDGATETTEHGKSVTVSNILETLESDLSYFYLRDGLGIPEDVMWKITADAPSVLGMKANNIRNKVQVLQSLVGFTDAEIRDLVCSQPGVLQLSVKKNISPTILYWIRQLEMGKDDLKALILGCPALLKYSRANMNRKLAFFQTTMGYSLSDCRKLLLMNPRLLTCSVKAGLIPRLNFLHKEVEMSLPDIRKVVLKNPSILLMSVENNLTPKCVFYFIMTLQMSAKDVGKMLQKYPQVLNYSLEHHILPINHYFLSLDLSNYEFARILQRYPRLITYSLIRIKRRIGYLRFELALEANAIRRILYQSPQILSLGQENLESSVEFLLQAVAPGASLKATKKSFNESDKASIDDSESIEDAITIDASGDVVEIDGQDALAIVQILISGLPSLLALSIENNLKPKVDYLRERLGQDELANSLLRMPVLLGYSLENRIRPRLEQILNANIPPKKITIAITLKEDAFNEWLKRETARQNKSSTMITVSKPSSFVTGPTIKPQENSKPKNQNEELSAIEADDTDHGTKNGNNRIVEKGGKIVHWRR